MSLPTPRSAAGAEALRTVLAEPGETLIGLDFDGTLAPIVDDPADAYADQDAVSALGRLGRQLGTVSVITGRPVRTAVRLGRFAETPGLESMVVLGQYGVERWNARGDDYVVPPDPPAVAALAAELPSTLAGLDLSGARIEQKGRAVVVHTRSLPDPGAAFRQLTDPLRELAQRHGLVLEPGKNVLEIRAPGVDKGTALRHLVTETSARVVVFAGDDLGDLPAFEAVRQLREEGVLGLLVCSASTEEDALARIADVVLDGPAGVATWLTELADALPD